MLTTLRPGEWDEITAIHHRDDISDNSTLLHKSMPPQSCSWVSHYQREKRRRTFILSVEEAMWF